MIHLSISGQPPRKSNSRRIVVNRRTGRPMLVKSAEALAWMEGADLQIPADARRRLGSAARPLSVTCRVRYKSKRPDLSVELILDLLQKAGVISDDRHVYEFHAYKGFDRDEPGVEVWVEEILTD
jgi:Holliday junction resolvase RusA-like endonuclease